jgi:hypothetical protein
VAIKSRVFFFFLKSAQEISYEFIRNNNNKKKKTENVIFAEAVRPPILEIFWQKQRSSGNNCIKQKAMVVGQKSSKSLGVILYVLPLLI